MTPESLLLFVASGWLLNLMPGPDVLYIVSNSLRGGVRAGVVASFGITTGCLVHIVAAAFGVGALMAASSLAFSVLKWLGAAYLLYVGIRMLCSQPVDAIQLGATGQDDALASDLKGIFFRGFWTNVLNPKPALFFLAFVPQFIPADASHKTLTFVLLGLLFNVNAIPVNLGYALLAGWAAKRAQFLQRGMHWLDRLAGALFVTFGVKLALFEIRPS